MSKITPLTDHELLMLRCAVSERYSPHHALGYSDVELGEKFLATLGATGDNTPGNAVFESLDGLRGTGTVGMHAGDWPRAYKRKTCREPMPRPIPADIDLHRIEYGERTYVCTYKVDAANRMIYREVWS